MGNLFSAAQRLGQIFRSQLQQQLLRARRQRGQQGTRPRGAICEAVGDRGAWGSDQQVESMGISGYAGYTYKSTGSFVSG